MPERPKKGVSQALNIGPVRNMALTIRSYTYFGTNHWFQMPKLLTRIIGLMLVPCLLADPCLAVTIPPELNPPLPYQSGQISKYFSEEALNGMSTMVINYLGNRKDDARIKHVIVPASPAHVETLGVWDQSIASIAILLAPAIVGAKGGHPLLQIIGWGIFGIVAATIIWRIITRYIGQSRKVERNEDSLPSHTASRRTLDARIPGVAGEIRNWPLAQNFGSQHITIQPSEPRTIAPTPRDIPIVTPASVEERVSKTVKEGGKPATTIGTRKMGSAARALQNVPMVIQGRFAEADNFLKESKVLDNIFSGTNRILFSLRRQPDDREQLLAAARESRLFVDKWQHIYDAGRMHEINEKLTRIDKLLENLIELDREKNRAVHDELSTLFVTLETAILKNLVIVDISADTLEEMGFVEMAEGSGYYLSAKECFLLITTKSGNERTAVKLLPQSPGSGLGSDFKEAQQIGPIHVADWLRDNGLKEIFPGSGVFVGEHTRWSVKQEWIAIADEPNNRLLFTSALSGGYRWDFKGKSSKVIGFKYFIDSIGLIGGAVRVEDNEARFELDHYPRVIAGTWTPKDNKEIALEPSPAQQYTQLRDAQGFQVGGINDDQTIRNLTHINGIPISALENAARPGHSSDAGFLNATERLVDVLAADNALVRARGLTHQQVAEPLFYMMSMLDRLRADSINELFYRGRRYAVALTRWRGVQATIFNDGTGASRDFSVTDLDTQQSIHFSELVPYYIARYGFYEGHTRYRLDPNAILSMFFITYDESAPVAPSSRITIAPLALARDWLAGFLIRNNLPILARLTRIIFGWIAAVVEIVPSLIPALFPWLHREEDRPFAKFWQPALLLATVMGGVFGFLFTATLPLADQARVVAASAALANFFLHGIINTHRELAEEHEFATAA